MDEKTAWIPYADKMFEQLRQLPLTELSGWNGQAITSISLPGIHSVIRVFSTDKLAKIALVSFCPGADLQYGLCTIFPKEEYRMPVFLSRWEERRSHIQSLVDFMPTVDILQDKDFRERYMESMGQLWEKYAALPGIWPEEHDRLRSACSIIYTATRTPIEREGLRLALLAPHTEYLKQYVAFAGAAAPMTGMEKQQEVSRKTGALRKLLHGCFRELLSGTAGCSGDALEKLLAVLL
jgi:hypothetical protein